MSSEVLLTFNAALAAEVAQNITKIADALSGFEGAIKLAKSSLGELTGVENASALQAAKFEKALGLSSSAMLDMNKETDALVKVINKNSEAFEKNKAKADLARGAIQEQIDKYKRYGEEVPGNLKKVQKQLDNTTKLTRALGVAGKVGTAMKTFADYASQVAGPLMEICGASARTKEQINGMIDGVSKVGEGLTQLAANPVAGTINIITGTLKFGLNAWQMWKDQGVRAAIDEERKFIEISGETEEKIVELTDKLDDAHAATSMYMEEIIKTAKINKENFNYYAHRTAEIIDDYKNKSLDLKQTQETIGKSFTALLENAKKLGTEGGRGMAEMITKLRASGIEAAEVQDYINKKLTDASAALKSFIKSFDTDSMKGKMSELKKEMQARDLIDSWEFMQTVTVDLFRAFQAEGSSWIETVKSMGDHLNTISALSIRSGLMISSGLREMTDMSAFIKENEVLVSRIDNTNKLMSSLVDSVHLTGESFQGFSRQAVRDFNSLIQAGASEQQALQILGPQLQELNDYANTYNVTLSRQTRNLIEKGRAAGVVAKKENDIFVRMNDLLYAIAEKLEAKIPKSAEATKKAFQNVQEAASIEFKMDKQDMDVFLKDIEQSMKEQKMSFEYEVIGVVKTGPHSSKTIETPITVDDRAVKNFLEKYRPAFQEFVKEVEKVHPLGVDFADADKAMSTMSRYKERLQEIARKHNLYLDDKNARIVLERFSSAFEAVEKRVEREQALKLKIQNEQAGMALKMVSTIVDPLIKNFEKQYDIKIDSTKVKEALAKVPGSLVPLVRMLEKDYHIKVNISQLKKLAEQAVKMLQPIISFFAKPLGLKVNIQEIIEKFLGLDKIVAEQERKTIEYTNTLRKAQQAARDSAQSLLETYGFLSDDALNKLNMESEALIDKIIEMTKEGKLNEEQQKKLGEAFQAQLDKYPDLTKASAKVQLVSDAWGFLEIGATKSNKAIQDEIDKTKKAEEELIKKNEQLDKSLGFLKKEDVTAEMNKMAEALERNKEQYKKNPELIEAVEKKMAELEKQARQSGATIPDSYKKQKEAMEGAKDGAVKLAEKDKKLREENDKLKKYLHYTDESLEGLTGEAREAALAEADLKKKTAELTDDQKKMADILGMSNEQFVKFAETTGKVGGALTDVSSHGKKVLGFLESTDIVSGETAEALGGLLDGVGSIGAGFTELATNPIGGAMKILGGVVKTVTSIFKLFAGDGVGEAIDREREMIDISEEMEKKIRDLEETLGDTHAATSMLMGEIIAEAEINEENFANYAQRTRDILASLDQGTLSIGQTQQALGSAFNELLSDAQRLGTEGSKEMIALIGDVRGRGLEVAEMQDYVNEKLDAGVAALQSYLGTFADSGAIQEQIAALNAELASGTLTAEEAMAKQEELALKQQELATATADVTANWDFMQVAAMSTFHALEAQGHSFVEIVAMMQDQLSGIGQMAEDNGLQISEGLAAMTNLSTFVSQNEELAARIDSTRIMMESLGDAAFLSANDFTMFAEQTALQFDQVMTKTTDQEMALRLISPALEDLIKYSESYGYQIDENTQALIDQAREEGVLAKEKHTDQEITNRLLLSIAEAWGAHIPAGLKKFRDEFDASMTDVQGQTNQFQNSLSDVEGQISGNLSTAVRNFDATYTNAMTGSSVVTETMKWSASLRGVEGQLKHDLVGGLSQVKHEAEGTFSKTQGNVNIVAKTIEELRNKVQAQLPVALTAMESTASTSFTRVQLQTGAWRNSLESVRTQITGNLTKAVRDFDKEYTDAMSGHSVVTETAKWSNALRHVQKTIDTDLIGSTEGLDKSFVETMSRLKDKLGDMEKDLQRTAIEGGNLDEVFQEYASSLGISTEQLKTLLGESSGGVIEISEEMQKKINELTETMGDAHAAESTLMNEIIRDADITVNNFDTYARRTREILDDYASGALDLKQTQEAMGSAFSELLKNAQELGTEGSKQMIALLRDVRTSGIEVAEMQDYVNDKLNKGVDALDKYISSFKSTTTLSDEYGDLNDKLSENLEALEKVEAEMLEGGKSQQELNDLRKEAARLEEERAKLLGDTIAKENELGAAQKEIAENWDFMQAAALSTFKALESEGHSFVEIVGMMDGQLTNLAQMAEENGLTVSEGIKEMTDMAAFVEQNEGLANRIDATKTMMEALGDTAYMKAGDFAMFSDQTKKQFDEIIAKGGDSQMALRLMAPALEDLVKYSESYGYTIDANTQSLIDQAREQGLLSEQQKTDAQVTNDILLLIAETMGAVIPESMKGMSDAMTDTVEGMDQKTARLDESLTGLGQTAVEKGIEVKEGLKEMTDMEAIDEENLAMLEKIEATREMMAQLGESAYMTGDDFAQFSEMTREQFMEMAAKTGDHEAALHLLGPALDDLTKYSEKFGFAVDDNTQSLIDQANQQEELAKKTGDGTKAANQHLMEMAKKYGLEIPDSLKVLTGDVKDSMNKIEEKTGDWNSSLDDVEGKIKEDLPKAIRDLDADYTDAMTGHSIVTETGKWKHSLEDVNRILGRELLETAESLDQKYKHVSGNIYEYLQKTSKGGYMARMTFDQMVNQLERVKNAYDKMAIKKRLSDKDKNIMEDYKRQIEELSEAIEETAPTLENFGKKFKEFQDRLGGDIAVNRGMIEIARGLREQGQSLKEIDDIIDKSLTGGSKGLGAWVNALGPAKKEIEELKKLQEEINELREKEELKEDELAKLEKMEADLLNRRTDAQQLFLKDQEELLNTQDMVVAYFHSMRAEGKSVSEIMEIMGDSFENLAEKSMAELTGTAGFEMTDAFSNLYNMQRKMADNEDLIKGVEGLTQALHGMGDSMLYMSDEEFGRFESSAVSAFKKLKDAGFDQKQSLQLIAPMLKDLKSYAAEYGFSLDKSTASMLKNAKEEGVLREKQKSDTEKLVEVNRQLASVMERLAGSLEKLGTVSPFAQLADEARALETQTARLKGFERQRKTVAKDIELAKSQAQRLIDDLAAAGGVSTETGAGLFELLLKKEEELEKLIKKQTDIERGYNRTRAEVERLQEEYNKNMPKQGDYISAALGYHGILEQDKWFRLHQGEQVDVWTPEETRKIQATPIRRMNLSDEHPGRTPKGDIIFEHITIQSENGEEAVKEFMTAIKGNKYGVQNLIRKVAH